MNKGRKSSKILKVFIVLLIGLILFFSNKKNQDKFLELVGSISTSNKQNWEEEEERSLQVLNSISIYKPVEKVACDDNIIAIWGNNELTIYDYQGSKKIQKEFNLNNPKAYIGRERIYVYDRDLGDIYLIDFYGNNLGSLQIGSEIKSLKDSKEYLMVHTIEENKEVLKILAFDGNILDTKLVEGNILTYCMDDDNSIYGICTLDLMKEGIRTEIKLYDLKGELLSTIHLADEISLKAEFIGENKLLVLTDKGLYFIEEGVIKWNRELEEVKDMYIDENKNINILKANTFESLLPDGNVEKKYTSMQYYDKITSFNDYIVLWGPNHIIGLQEGEEIFKYESNDQIYDVIGKKEHLIVVYHNRLDIISYE